jgi:hypothetical protein
MAQNVLKFVMALSLTVLVSVKNKQTDNKRLEERREESRRQLTEFRRTLAEEERLRSGRTSTSS